MVRFLGTRFLGVILWSLFCNDGRVALRGTCFKYQTRTFIVPLLKVKRKFAFTLKYLCRDDPMNIFVNGKLTSVAEGTSVAKLLQELDKNPKFLAVERNEELVPRRMHAECLLEADDRIEIVTLVGGG